MDLHQFTVALALGKTALDLAGGVLDLIPDSTKREAAKSALDQSRRAFAAAETQMAEQLGYPLCRCDFPPGICTLNEQDRYICRKCGKDRTPPPEEYAAALK